MSARIAAHRMHHLLEDKQGISTQRPMAVATQLKKVSQKTWGFRMTPVRDQVSEILSGAL